MDTLGKDIDNALVSLTGALTEAIMAGDFVRARQLLNACEATFNCHDGSVSRVINYSLDQNEMELVKANKKIEAIKSVRYRVGGLLPNNPLNSNGVPLFGLKEAKDLVEKYAQSIGM